MDQELTESPEALHKLFEEKRREWDHGARWYKAWMLGVTLLGGFIVVDSTYVAITTGPLVVNGQQTTWAGTIEFILGALFTLMFMLGLGALTFRQALREHRRELAEIHMSWKRAIREASVREAENLAGQEAPEHCRDPQSEWLGR